MERLGEYSKTICASGLLSNWNILLRTCWPLVKTKRVTFYGGSPQLYFDSFVKSLAKVLFAQGLGSAQFFTFPQSPNRCHAGGSNLGPVGCQSTPSLSMHWLTAPENPLPHMWQEHSDQSMARSRGHKPRHRWQADTKQTEAEMGAVTVSRQILEQSVVCSLSWTHWATLAKDFTSQLIVSYVWSNLLS